MEEDYNLYQRQPGSSYELTFEVDINLLNTLRSFQHQDHQFKEGYLESIFTYLYYYQGKPDTELFQSFSSNNGGHTVETMIFAVHYYLASILNLQPLLKALNQTHEIASLSRSEVNKTNILSVHAIIDRQGLINHQLLVEKSKQLQPNYLQNFHVCISSTEEGQLIKETNTLRLDFYKLSLAIRAKGKLDPYVTSHIANILNKGYALDLGHVLLAFCKDITLASQNYDDRFLGITKGMRDHAFTKEKYLQFRDKAVQYSNPQQYNKNTQDELWRLLNDIDSEVGKLIIARDTQSNKYVEKLLIGLLGHPLQIIRDQAVILLNVLYDGVDWQRRASYKPRIARVGQKFIIEYLIELEDNQNPQSIVLLLKSFIFDGQCKQNVVSWHKPKLIEHSQLKGKRYLVFSMDFGRFQRCGFYDWKLIRMTNTGKLNSMKKIMSDGKSIESSTNLQQYEKFQESKPVQGRFIVHPAYTTSLQIHELYVDLVDAKPDNQGKFSKRGNFARVAKNLPEYAKQGINCLYLMGALERDNGFTIDTNTQQKSFIRAGVSPMAITDRRTPNTMLGGPEAFKDLLNKAKQSQIKIIVDGMTRISSARANRRYRKFFINKLDKEGKLIPHYGADGRSLSFEDTAILNYRKQSTWNLFLEELQYLRDHYGIDGVHLDNSQQQPQIFALDTDEMFRTETNNESAYSVKDIFNGKVVLAHEDSGFWGSSIWDSYANPFLIKLCKRMWERYPDFFILAEAWGAMGGQEEREISLIQSGVIPRLFKLPVAIASVLGESLKTDGSIQSTERQNAIVTVKKLEQAKKDYPPGAILVQSTTYHSWPYPALMYKRGTWAAIDFFFMTRDIPMTFLAEQEGQAFREKTTLFFSTQMAQEVKIHDPTRQQERKLRKMKRADSFIKEDDMGFGYNTYQGGQYMMIQSSSPTKQQMLRVQSGSSLSQMDIAHIEGAQENFRREVGPQFGFDLKMIGGHYQHRRQLRHEKKVLQKGKFIQLSAEHQHGWHTHVVCFARYTKKQVALVAINFNDGEVDLFITLKNLRYYFPDSERSDVVVRLVDWSNNKEDENTSYYFIGEFINERIEATLKNFHSMIWGIDILTNDKDAQAKAELCSLRRLQLKLSQNIPPIIQGNDIAQRIVTLATNSVNLQGFVNGYLDLHTKIFTPYGIDINRLLAQMKRFQTDKQLLYQLFAYFNSIVELKNQFPDIEEKLPFYTDLKNVLQANKLGPIVFLCPELGKWTTTGGLGVMVDELTSEMAKMGEDVYVISPYYERNKKNETNYLKSEFDYKSNVDVWVGSVKYTLGVHYGVVNGVKLFWIHNPEVFPMAYVGEDPAYVMRQLAVFAKGALELLCQNQIIPSTMVTNDWFCGLVPAYLKDPRFFGQTFASTKSFHIVHNLDPLYEGRLYPKEDLGYIHELPSEMLIDPYWQNKVVNPSRCALLACDSWGTVSQSYKIELLRDSPLVPVLRKHPNPFAFPNGIRRQARLQVIFDKTNNDHLKAKEALQKKYFQTKGLQDNYPVFGFVGRITKQKGVHLICDIVEELVNKFDGKVHILVGGQADMREEYSQECAIKMQRLRNKYPLNFWADPTAFFTDGTLVNVGCDFGLMPSLFEPGGIVQHEFFIGSTPVIAFKTGGLRDTVHEYDMKTQKGCGFTFEQYTRGDFLYAVSRAIAVFNQPQHYAQIRKNSFEAAIDVADVGRAWTQEFYRLYNKNFIDKEFVEQQRKQIDQTFSLEAVVEDNSMFKKVEGRVFTKKDELNNRFEKIISAATKLNLRQQIFTFRSTKISQPRQVQLSGSFDDWKVNHRLKFDHYSKTWNISLQLQPGEYFYKFLVDNEWVCTDDDIKDTDINGNINNYILVE